MAFNPEEERRRGRRSTLESGMLGGSPDGRGGMLSAAGTFVPKLNPFARMSSPYMPSQTYPGAGGKPMMFPTYHDALDYWMANPSPGIDRPNPANWATPSQTPPTGTLDPIPQQKSEAWWAAQPRPSFVPADWVYIGMGDWGPPQPTLAPGDIYGPPTYPGGPGDLVGNLGSLPGLLGPVPGES